MLNLLLGGLATILILFPSAATAAEPWDFASDLRCETARLWTSRHQGRTPTSRQECVLALARPEHQVRITHQRRGQVELGLRSGIQSGPLSALAPSLAFAHPLALADAAESSSQIELRGTRGRWKFETEFDLARQPRLDGGHLLPEERARLLLETGLDLGIVRPRVAIQGSRAEAEVEFGDGLHLDPPSTSRMRGHAFVDLVLPHAPVLTLGVGREQHRVTRSPHDDTERIDSDVMSAALWYGRSNWQAYAVSSLYSFENSLHGDGAESVLRDHFVSGSYWPTSTLTISPSLQYTESSFDDRASWTRTVSASLGVYSTGLLRNGLMSFWTGYTSTRDTSKTVDYGQFDVAVRAEQTLGALAFLKGYGVAIGASVGVSHYMDRKFSDATAPTARAQLTVRVAAF